MPAHKREIIRHRCHCGKSARFDVFNTWGAPMGSFCSRCADTAVKRLNAPPPPSSDGVT